jgi:hypothetical protein
MPQDVLYAVATELMERSVEKTGYLLMSIIKILLPFLCMCLLLGDATAQGPLQFAGPDQLPIADSIPGKANEKVVIFAKQQPAYWVIALVSLSYDQARAGMRDAIRDSLGIRSENEIRGRVDPGIQFDPWPEEPLLGAGGINFHGIGVNVTEGRETRIETKRYNESWWNNYSVSTWRIIDCTKLFGKTCSLIVVTRTDHFWQWAVWHPGIPLPLKFRNEQTIVTDTETKMFEAFQEAKQKPKLQYFVLPNPYFSSTVLTEVMTAIRDGVKVLP